MDISEHLGREAAGYYGRGKEQNRLTSHQGQLELVRTQELLLRYLPAPPSVVLDVGGGPGAYAFWLAELGYRVHLIDAMPLHIEQAQQMATGSEASVPETMSVGDARRLPHADSTADAILLLGPLYHLTDRHDRLLALREAYRVLRPGTRVFAVGISRFASALDGLFQGYLRDPEFVEIVKQDLVCGQHRNPTNHPGYFTTTFFHHPDELRAEVGEAGFTVEHLLAIEGPVWSSLANFWEDGTQRGVLFDTIHALEAEPSLLGASPHIMAVGWKAK